MRTMTDKTRQRIIDEEIKPLFRAKAMLVQVYDQIKVTDGEGNRLPTYTPEQFALQGGVWDAINLLYRSLCRQVNRIDYTRDDYEQWGEEAYREVMRELGKESVRELEGEK